MTTGVGLYSLPVALLQYMDWAQHHRPEKLVVKPTPVLPIVITSDFFVYRIEQGPVMKVTMSPRIGNLLGVA